MIGATTIEATGRTKVCNTADFGTAGVVEAAAMLLGVVAAAAILLFSLLLCLQFCVEWPIRKKLE